MKTIFSRLFSMIAALLMLCLLITGVAFRFLMMSWVESEKRKSLSADASALADLAEAYDSAGELESNWNFQIGLSLFSEVGEVSAMICDEDGYVVICSCDNLTCGAKCCARVCTMKKTCVLPISMTTRVFLPGRRL